MRMLCRNVPFLTKTAARNTARNLFYHRQQHRSRLLFSNTDVSTNRLLTVSRFCSVKRIKEDESAKYKVATIPNAICVIRIAATPIIGYLVVNQNFTTALILFVTAGFTDFIDGYIARHFKGQKSLLGSVLDPMADKLLISVMFLTMTHANLVPLPLTCIIILRDICLIIGGFSKRYQTMQPPYSLNRFFNPEVSPMQVVPTAVSKINTVLQLAAVAASLSSPVFELGAAFNQGLSILYWTTATTTIYSGLQYACGRAIKKV